MTIIQQVDYDVYEDPEGDEEDDDENNYYSTLDKKRSEAEVILERMRLILINSHCFRMAKPKCLPKIRARNSTKIGIF